MIEEELKSYAIENAPHECWGYVIFDGTFKLVKSKNISLNKTEHVQVNPLEFVKLKKNLVATFHSHPTPPSSINQFDIDICNELKYPTVIYTNYLDRFDYINPDICEVGLENRPFWYGVYDCYTCFRDAYQKKQGVVLKNYKAEWGWWAKGGNEFENNFKNAGFYEIGFDELKDGDGLLMKWGSRVINHIGYYEKGKVLHQYMGRGSVWENIDKLANRVEKVIRYSFANNI